MKVEAILNREQKESLIKQCIANHRPHLDREIVSLRYDRRFGFDFEVTRGPAGKARVMFAVSVDSPRFSDAVEDCAQAVYDIRFSGTTASAIRGRVKEDGQ